MDSSTPRDRTVLSEFGLIDWIRDRVPPGRSTLLGIGDDCAMVRLGHDARMLITTDMLMDGRHFRLDEQNPEDIGYKALAVNVSDIAAMAGRPIAAVVAVALPKSEAKHLVHALQEGLSEAAERFEVDIVGGDTNAWDGPLVVSVTLIGVPVGRGAVTRAGARVGDAIYVTGPLGGSILGRHLRPQARVSEAITLNASAELHAMIDISDGLASDLGHILKESGELGALLQEDAIPIHADAFRLSESGGRSPLSHALGDGEDFELCFCVGPEVETLWQAEPPGNFPIHWIGRVTEQPGIRIEARDGEVEDVLMRGFDHLA